MKVVTNLVKLIEENIFHQWNPTNPVRSFNSLSQRHNGRLPQPDHISTIHTNNHSYGRGGGGGGGGGGAHHVPPPPPPPLYHPVSNKPTMSLGGVPIPGMKDIAQVAGSFCQKNHNKKSFFWLSIHIISQNSFVVGISSRMPVFTKWWPSFRMLMQRNKKKSGTWWRRGGKRPCWWTEFLAGSSQQVSFCSTSSTGRYLEITTSGEGELRPRGGCQYFLKYRHYRYIYLCYWK